MGTAPPTVKLAQPHHSDENCLLLDQHHSKKKILPIMHREFLQSIANSFSYTQETQSHMLISANQGARPMVLKLKNHLEGHYIVFPCMQRNPIGTASHTVFSNQIKFFSTVRAPQSALHLIFSHIRETYRAHILNQKGALGGTSSCHSHTQGHPIGHFVTFSHTQWHPRRHIITFFFFFLNLTGSQQGL